MNVAAMQRAVIAFAVMITGHGPAPAQTTALSSGEIDKDRNIKFGSALKLGKREGNKTVITPDRLQILGAGSTGDVSGMSVAIPQVAGTVPRSLSDKMRDVISVKDFGAKGDGTTDDTTALKALAQRVRAIHKAHVFFPCGTYKITDTVTWDTANNLAIDGRSSECVTIDLAVNNPSIPAFILQNGDGSIAPSRRVCGGLPNQQGPCGRASGIGFSRPPGVPVAGNAAIVSKFDINSDFSNIRLVGYFRGIEFRGSYAGRVNRGTFVGTRDASVWFDNDGSANNAVIERNYIIGGGRGTSTACIDIGYQAQQPQVINNDIEFCYIAIRSRGSHGTRIQGNYVESSEKLNIKFEGSNSISSTTGFNSAWAVKSNLFAKPKSGLSDTYENVNGVSFDGNILPGLSLNWSATALRVDLGRTNLAAEGGNLGSPVNPAPFASGQLGVGAPGAPATFTSNGSDLFINAGVTNTGITLRPDGVGSVAGQVAATTLGFAMTAGAILSPNTFASLPDCNGTTAGTLRWITDAQAATYNANVSGGGTTSLLAFCNGSSWTAH